MKEYYGDGAKKYAVTERKQMVLLPAIERAVGPAQPGQKLLDLACGNGAFHDFAVAKGYKYVGLDISEDMIDEARNRFPEGEYIVADAIDYAGSVSEKFDTILSVLLLPSLNRYQKIVSTLKSCKETLKEGGRLIIGTVHPSFDQYMHVGLLGKQGINTDFQGYFNTGAKFTFTKQFPGGDFVFEDYHYTLMDYFNTIKEAGLTLESIDECPPDADLKDANPELYGKYSLFPGYIVFVCS